MLPRTLLEHTKAITDSWRETAIEATIRRDRVVGIPPEELHLIALAAGKWLNQELYAIKNPKRFARACR